MYDLLSLNLKVCKLVKQQEAVVKITLGIRAEASLSSRRGNEGEAPNRG